jgi:peroxiredoxin/uncharacterized membrane protein YphA (DoxX/SURF4 family)
MEIVLLLARILLAVIFAVAGIAKLTDQKGTRRAMAGVGVPDSFVALLAGVLPVIELIVALALLQRETAWLGSLGSLSLLLAFLIGISVNLAGGKTLDYHCFGQLHSEPVSWSLFGRNVLLAVMATFIVGQGREHLGLSVLAFLQDLRAGEAVSLVLSAVIILLLFPLYQIVRKGHQEQRLLLEAVTAIRKELEEDHVEPGSRIRAEAVPPMEGLPIGAQAPTFSLVTVSGDQTSLDDLLALGQPVLLLFVSPICSPCKALLPFIKAWQHDYGEYITVAVLSTGTKKEVQSKMTRSEARYLLLQGDSSVAEDYRTRWTPSALLIDQRGKIASPVAAGDKAIRALLTQTITSSTLQTISQNRKIDYKLPFQFSSSPFKLGDLAPSFSLPDLQGQEVTFEDLWGGETMLLFWHPRCRFCEEMFDDLQKWDEQTPIGAPRLVLIASGEVEDIRAINKAFKSLTLLDPAFEIAPLFGTKVTPSAILVDSEGRIASGLATDVHGVRALLGLPKADASVIAGILAR